MNRRLKDYVVIWPPNPARVNYDARPTTPGPSDYNQAFLLEVCVAERDSKK